MSRRGIVDKNEWDFNDVAYTGRGIVEQPKEFLIVVLPGDAK